MKSSVRRTGHEELAAEAEKAVDEMYQAVLDAGWDGKWFLRAYDAQSEKLDQKSVRKEKSLLNRRAFVLWQVLERRGTGRKSIGFCT